MFVIFINIYKYTTIHDFYDFDIGMLKSKMAAKDCETNMIGFIIDIRSRVKCQMSFPKYGSQTRATILNFTNFNKVA